MEDKLTTPLSFLNVSVDGADSDEESNIISRQRGFESTKVLCSSNDLHQSSRTPLILSALGILSAASNTVETLPSACLGSHII